MPRRSSAIMLVILFTLSGFAGVFLIISPSTKTANAQGLAAWSTQTSAQYPGSVNAACVVAGGYVYCEGTSANAACYSAPITGGVPSTSWSSINCFTSSSHYTSSGICLTDGSYVICGAPETTYTNSFYATISGGSAGTFSTQATGFQFGPGYPPANCAYSGGYAYCVGSPWSFYMVYGAATCCNGFGTWTYGTNLPVSMTGPQVAIVGGTIYAIDGAAAYYATISGTTFGTWKSMTAIPSGTTMSNGQCFDWEGYLTCVPTTWGYSSYYWSGSAWVYTTGPPALNSQGAWQPYGTDTSTTIIGTVSSSGSTVIAYDNPPSVTLPLKICLKEASAGSGSFGLSGGSVSPSTATGSYGCTTTSLTINPSSTLTVTVPTDSTYYRYRMNSTSTSATTEQVSSCASGTCATIQIDSYEEVYYDFSLTPSAPATWDNAYSETATGTAIGAGSQTLATVTLSSGGGAANSHGWGDIGTTATLPASFASAVSGTWQSSGSYSFTLSSTSGGTANTNYDLLDSLTEIVTITVTPSGPTGTFAISGCDSTAATIQSDGSPHTFHADYSCLLTFTKPTDGANTRYRFGGSVGTWTYTTGASGTDTKSSPVYYEESQGVSYSRTCVSGATCSTVPTFAYTVAGSSNKYFLTTSSTPVYVDSGTTATVNATLTDNLGDVYSTSPYSWVISGVNTVTNPAVYSADPTTLPIKACDLSPLGTHATLTITGGSPSPGTVPADCSSHNVTINPSTSVTVSLQSATNSTRYFFKDLTTSVALTTCASGSCSLLNKTYFEQFVIVEGDPTPDLILTGINNGSIYSADQVRTWFDAGTNFTVNGLSAGIWRASLTSWIYQEPAQGFQLLANRTLGNIYFMNYGVQFTGAKAYVRFLIPITWTLEEVETGATSSSLSSIPYSQFENPQEIAFSGALAYWNVLMYPPTSPPPPPCYSCGGSTTTTQTTTATSISTIISTTGSNGSGSLGIGQPGGNLTQPLAVTSPIPQVPQGLFIIALVLILIMLLAIAAVSRRREFETAGDQIKAELRSSSSIGPLSLGNRAKPRKKKS